MADLAIVGQRELILSLGALGFSLYCAHDAIEARDAITQAEKDGAKIIFVFEKLAAAIAGELKEKTEPLIVLIPDYAGSTGIANGLIKRAMAKAIGVEEIKI